jgi:two-component sensor histidine kinase
MGNSQKVFENFESYQILNDSIAYQEQLKVVAETEGKFQNEKKQLEIDFLNKDNAQRSRNLYIAIGGILLLSILTLITLRLYRQKQIANKELASQNKLISDQKNTLNKQNQEKELLLKEIHHRVKNNFQIISSLLDLQSRKSNNPDTTSMIEEGKSRIKSMALIHEKLYQNENIVSINFKEYTEQLSNGILATLSKNTPQLYLDIPNNIQFDIDTAIPLGLIMNELLTNACKYAFDSERKGKLHLQLQKIDDDYLFIVKDDGHGLPPNFDFQKARSLGLRLVRRLSKQLFGKTTYQYDNGATFTFQFKDTLTRNKFAR